MKWGNFDWQTVISITCKQITFNRDLRDLGDKLLEVSVLQGRRAFFSNPAKKMQPSDFVTYRVSKKLFDLNIISRETFLFFATEFAKLIKSLRKEGDTAVDWDAVREMFDFDDDADVVPINAANLCPSIHAVQVFVNQMGIDMNKDVSIQKRTSVFATVIDFARALIANQLNISTDELAFMRNSTEANNVINLTN